MRSRPATIRIRNSLVVQLAFEPNTSLHRVQSNWHVSCVAHRGALRDARAATELDVTMNEHAFWPGTKVLRKESRQSGAGSALIDRGNASNARTIALLNEALAIAQGTALRCERQY